MVTTYILNDEHEELRGLQKQLSTKPGEGERACIAWSDEVYLITPEEILTFSPPQAREFAAKLLHPADETEGRIS